MSEDHKKTTLRDIADQAGVSVATVSRVLRNQASRYRIKDETVSTVMRCARDLRYDSDLLDQNYRFVNTYSIGLIVPDISNPFFSAIAQRIEVEAKKKGYLIILTDTMRDIALEKEAIRLLRDRNVDGFILAAVGTKGSHLSYFQEEDIPVVMIDRYFKEIHRSYVISDNHGGAYEATRYLIENGHRKIGCIQGEPQTSVNQERLLGYFDALKAHEIPVDRSLVVGDSFTEQSGYVSTKVLLNRCKPTAIFGLNNFTSLGAFRAIVEEGFSIPDDISLIAFDDYQPYMGIVSPPITAIHQQNEEIGHIAFQLLLDQMESDHPIEPSRVTLATDLVIRKSVRDISE